jgi:uncharacterized membrane protein
VTQAPAPTLGRKIVGVFINAFGLVAAAAGLYCAGLGIAAIFHIVMLTRARSTAGLGSPAIAIVGMFDVVFVFVFIFLAVICLSIGAWILEPLRRWRGWRLRRAQRAARISTDP